VIATVRTRYLGRKLGEEVGNVSVVVVLAAVEQRITRWWSADDP